MAKFFPREILQQHSFGIITNNMKFFKNLFKRNNDELIELYLVSESFEMLEGNKFPDNLKVYTITSSEKDCEEYINTLMKLKNASHYDMWCQFNANGVKDDATWRKYASTVLIEQLKEIIISKVEYPKSRIAEVFRMFSGCTPIGCSYEGAEEYNYFVNRLDPTTRQQIEKLIETEDKMSGIE